MNAPTAWDCRAAAAPPPDQAAVVKNVPLPLLTVTSTDGVASTDRHIGFDEQGTLVPPAGTGADKKREVTRPMARFDGCL